MHTGEEDRLWNQPFSQLFDFHDLDLDLGSGHTAYLRVALIHLYRWNRKKTFLWTDGRTLGVDVIKIGSRDSEQYFPENSIVYIKRNTEEVV